MLWIAYCIIILIFILIVIFFQDPTSRVLVCTHSNSAADLYIREYLHPYIEKENPDIRLLRVYYKNRWVQTVHATVLKYCLVTQTDTSRVFRYPVAEDITDCQVVVATLSTSRWDITFKKLDNEKWAY